MVRERAETHIKGEPYLCAYLVRKMSILSSAKLANSRFGSDEYLKAIVEEFDKTTKKHFKDHGYSMVKFSSIVSDSDPSFGIRSGKLKLTQYA
jgi:hypothetical protein